MSKEKRQHQARMVSFGTPESRPHSPGYMLFYDSTFERMSIDGEYVMVHSYKSAGFLDFDALPTHLREAAQYAVRVLAAVEALYLEQDKGGGDE